MDYVFLDTSALVKLYVDEVGSSWLTNYVQGKQVIISELALLESATALGKKYRDGFFTRGQVVTIYRRIYRDKNKFDLIPFGLMSQTNQVSMLAFDLPIDRRLRALDGIHLVAAKEAQNNLIAQTTNPNFVFVTSDKTFRQVLQFVGFVTENPEDHP